MGARYQDTKPSCLSFAEKVMMAIMILCILFSLAVFIRSIWDETHIEEFHGWKNERTTVGVITRLGFTPARAIKNGKFTNYSDNEWFIQVEDGTGTKIWSGSYLGRFVRMVKEGEKVSIDHADRYVWTVRPFGGESKREFVMDEILRITPILPLESD